MSREELFNKICADHNELLSTVWVCWKYNDGRHSLKDFFSVINNSIPEVFGIGNGLEFKLLAKADDGDLHIQIERNGDLLKFTTEDC